MINFNYLLAFVASCCAFCCIALSQHINYKIFEKEIQLQQMKVTTGSEEKLKTYNEDIINEDIHF